MVEYNKLTDEQLRQLGAIKKLTKEDIEKAFLDIVAAWEDHPISKIMTVGEYEAYCEQLNKEENRDSEEN